MTGEDLAVVRRDNALVAAALAAGVEDPDLIAERTGLGHFHTRIVLRRLARHSGRDGSNHDGDTL